MTLFSRIIITSVLCFLVAGCSTPLLYFKSELKAWDHIARAAELEKSENYSQAAKEYTFVAELYPSTSYYQTAVRKAALLNIHPSNSEMDFNAAHKWLQVYLSLPVPPEEKESVRSNIALLKHVIRLETKLVHICKEKDKINAEKDLVLSVAQKQSCKIKTSTRQIEKLEKMLLQSQGQLEEIKKVDLQMHTRKVNGDTNKPSQSAYKIHNFLPEAYSEDTSTTLSQKIGASNSIPVAKNQPTGIPARPQQIETLKEKQPLTQEQPKKDDKTLQVPANDVSKNGSKTIELHKNPSKMDSAALSMNTLKTQHKKDGATEPATGKEKALPPINEKVAAPHSNKVSPRSKKSSAYPYTIQISSFFKKEDSIRAAAEPRNRGNILFTSPAYIQGKGYWYRVFIGLYGSLKEAKKTALELKKQKHPHAFVSKMPFAIQIKTDTPDEDLNAVKTELQSRGFLAYNIPDNPNTNKAALLIGAFRTKKEANKQAGKLRGQGFKPKVVRR